MSFVQNFFKDFTAEQRSEIDWLCKKGVSSNNFTCYIGAPVQGLTALVFAAVDVPAAPVKGLGRACICLIKGSGTEAVQEVFTGLKAGFRSLFQIVILIGAVAGGIFFPNRIYSALQKLNSTKADGQNQVPEGADNASPDEKCSQTEEISRLQSEIRKLQRSNEKKVEAVKAFKEGLGYGDNAITLRDLLTQLQEERSEKAQVSKQQEKMEDPLLREQLLVLEEKLEKANAQREDQEKLSGKVQERLEKDLSQLQKQLKLLGLQKDEESAAVQKLKSKIEKVNGALVQFQTSNASLEEQKETAEQTSIELKNKLRRKEEELNDLEEQLNDLKGKFTSAKETLGKDKEELSKNLRAKLDAKNEEILQLQNKVRILDLDQQELSDKVQKLKVENEKKDSAFGQLQKELEALESEKIQLEARFLDLTKALTDKGEELNRLRQIQKIRAHHESELQQHTAERMKRKETLQLENIQLNEELKKLDLSYKQQEDRLREIGNSKTLNSDQENAVNSEAVALKEELLKIKILQKEYHRRHQENDIVLIAIELNELQHEDRIGGIIKLQESFIQLTAKDQKAYDVAYRDLQEQDEEKIAALKKLVQKLTEQNNQSKKSNEEDKAKLGSQCQELKEQLEGIVGQKAELTLKYQQTTRELEDAKESSSRLNKESEKAKELYTDLNIKYQIMLDEAGKTKTAHEKTEQQLRDTRKHNEQLVNSSKTMMDAISNGKKKIENLQKTKKELEGKIEELNQKLESVEKK